MGTFDINDIIARYKPNIEELASVLFPHAKYPLMAFSRVLEGKTKLDTQQIQNLATFLGVNIYDLFTISGWAGLTEDKCLTFVKDDYKIKLNYNGAYLLLYKKEKLIYKELSCTTNMTIEEFINYINNLIKNQENGTN